MEWFQKTFSGLLKYINKSVIYFEDDKGIQRFISNNKKIIQFFSFVILLKIYFIFQFIYKMIGWC